jgi:hypothetical protein
MRLLVLCTPSSNGIAKMGALVVYLSVVTHAGREGLQGVIVDDSNKRNIL